MNPFPKRKQNRLTGYDYSSTGTYFITICSNERKPIFSKILVGADIIRPCVVQLTECGKIIKNGIENIPKIYKNVSVDYYVIMPNHIHFLISIQNNNGRIVSAPTIIGQFKRYVSKQCNCSVWQKGFYDHIIRDNEDYAVKAEYILNNPLKWTEDELYCE